MIINDKSQTDLSGFYIVYKGSVLNENPSNYGITHLMEHLMCKTFQKYYNDFERYSINWNALTTNNEIVFYMVGIDEYLYKYRHLLLDALLEFDISREDFENEKNVVIQEYKDIFQDQQSSAYYNLLRKTHHNYGPIGKLESLENISYDDIIEYWKKYLSKPTMIINISKNTNFDGYNDFNLNYPNKYIPSKVDNLKYEKLIDFNKSTVFGHIKINDNMNYVDFILSLLSQSLESPFMKEIREKRGLTYGVGTGISKISDNEGLIITNLITTDEKVDEVLDVYKMILSNPDKYITRERFETIKDYYIVKRKKDDISRYSNVDKYIKPELWQIDKIIDKITMDDVFNFYDKYLNFDSWNWVIDKKQF